MERVRRNDPLGRIRGAWVHPACCHRDACCLGLDRVLQQHSVMSKKKKKNMNDVN